ncbi:MAG: hypothetical protein IPJ75_16215 [Ignavibacteriales bacterium]|nr:hypothetical protein [Ignavibacteriales bacterium]
MSLMRIFVVAVMLVGGLFAQTVFTRVDHPVYGLLSRLDARQIIDFNSEVLPLSRMEVAQLLLRIEDSRDKLNPLELQELRFFLEEFALEVAKYQSHEVDQEPSPESQAGGSHRVTESRSRFFNPPLYF